MDGPKLCWGIWGGEEKKSRGGRYKRNQCLTLSVLTKSASEYQPCHAQSGHDHVVCTSFLVLNEYEGKDIKIRCKFIDNINHAGKCSCHTASTSDSFHLNWYDFCRNFSFLYLVWIYACVLRVSNLALFIYLSVTQIFDLLESELPADFNRKFGLSWNLLKASIGSKRGKAQSRKSNILFTLTKLKFDIYREWK